MTTTPSAALPACLRAIRFRDLHPLAFRVEIDRGPKKEAVDGNEDDMVGEAGCLRPVCALVPTAAAARAAPTR